MQVIGDGSGKGGVRHLWERDCSVQRRFQKIFELAPCFTADRGIMVEVIEAAVSMAEEINYLGLGTWEFLVNAEKGVFYFLEIHPRLQVEHTITEGISGIDLVPDPALARARSINGRHRFGGDARPVATSQLPFDPTPAVCRRQLDLQIKSFRVSSGNGIRVDTHLAGPILGVVGSDFDNLIAQNHRHRFNAESSVAESTTGTGRHRNIGRENQSQSPHRNLCG